MKRIPKNIPRSSRFSGNVTRTEKNFQVFLGSLKPETYLSISKTITIIVKSLVLWKVTTAQGFKS